MSNYVEVKLGEIFVDDGFNCRGKLEPIDVVDLARDIEARGLIQPVTVAPYVQDGYKYRLIAGFRRTFACRILEHKIIAAIVRDDMIDPKEARLFNLAENVQRQDLNVLQEAHALQHLYDMGLGQLEIAERLGKSRGWVQIRACLLQLPDNVQNEAEAGFITHTQIRDLYTILKTDGAEAVFKATREIKDRVLKGDRSVNIKYKSSKDYKSKRVRQRSEMRRMMDFLVTNIGYGIHTEVLGWAGGEQTTEEFCDSVRAKTDELGRTYIPFEGAPE